MSQPHAPVLAHQNWRFLLREFTRAHPQFQAVTAAALQRVLSVPASVAWWISTYHPELAARSALHVLVPGAGATECDDGGRWLAFVPWFMGAGQCKVRVTLVGEQLMVDHENRPMYSEGAGRMRLERTWKTGLGALVENLPGADIVNGRLAEWRKQAGAVVPDVCVMFAPGFEAYLKSWMTEEDLLPVLRASVPIGVFPYSVVDGLVDMHVLRACGVLEDTPKMRMNPWHLPNPNIAKTGAFAHVAWELQPPALPEQIVFSQDRFQELADLQWYLREDFAAGGDVALAHMGGRVEIRKCGLRDALFILPRGFGVTESDGIVGKIDVDGFLPTQPPVTVPREELLARPEDIDLIGRWKWAVQLHKKYVATEADPARSMELDKELFDVLTAGAAGKD